MPKTDQLGLSDNSIQLGKDRIIVDINSIFHTSMMTKWMKSHKKPCLPQY